MTLQNRQWYLHSRPEAVPTEDNLRPRSVPLKRPGPGQVLMQNLYLSMDPGARFWMSDKPGYMDPIPIGGTMRGSTLGRIVESNHPKFSVGDYAVGIACNGWEDFSLIDPEQNYVVSADEGFPVNYHLSVFSAVGLTPYFGLLEIGKPKPGETLLVSIAAGAVGSLAGQIGKIKGCHTVGIAGSDEKCRWIVEELGFDAAINYKTCGDMQKAIAEACPNGVDIYFDNVTGNILDAALLNMNNFGRIVFCGAIAQYNTDEPVPGPFNYWQILARSLTVRGYIALEFQDRFPEAVAEMRGWLDAGRLQFAEEIAEGFENTVATFARLFDGSNKGKLMVKLRDISEPAPTLDEIRAAAEPADTEEARA
ncbi:MULTISPECIES: NADP-dependent oxidoreductase [Pseudomonas]|uniref:NADP-dependent oxidoreductase n=2 Tax=Pseudomonas TaxID=286 RepID=UPI00123BD721|nr:MULTISPECIES: NADP-dependent oxidoreductase [Pseudomonas]QIB49886.1 NADP-dependent oxidoreductase [Pseudomonas sp. OIL-1]